MKHSHFDFTYRVIQKCKKSVLHDNQISSHWHYHQAVYCYKIVYVSLKSNILFVSVKNYFGDNNEIAYSKVTH